MLLSTYIDFIFSNWFQVYRFNQSISHVAEGTFINFWNWFSQRGPNINKEVIKSIANDIFIWSYQIISNFESVLS